MKVKEVRDEIESGRRLTIVDVRSCSEFAVGHIPGAVHIPMEEIEARLDDLPSDQPIFLACQSGDRAKMACDLIRSHRPLAQVLEGGTEAWIAAGLPTVASTSSRWSIDRQVRLTAGLIVLAGTLLSVAVDARWVYLAMFIGAGLTFAGLSNICGMAALYAQMPWNKPRKPSAPVREAQAR